MKLLDKNYRRLMAEFRKKCGGRHFVGRRMTHDISYTFRMNAGFPGDPNRTHPVTIEPALMDTTNPSTAYGQAVIVNTSANTVRIPASGDSGATTIYGILVRPYPIQQAQTSTNFGGVGVGAATPPTSGQVDVLRAGYIIVPFQGAAAAAKGGQVYLCVVAGTGYVVGAFSADTVIGTFATLSANYQFNGPADANGNVELMCNV